MFLWAISANSLAVGNDAAIVNTARRIGEEVVGKPLKVTVELGKLFLLTSGLSYVKHVRKWAAKSIYVGEDFEALYAQQKHIVVYPKSALRVQRVFIVYVRARAYLFLAVFLPAILVLF